MSCHLGLANSSMRGASLTRSYSRGESVKIKAHGGLIDIVGIVIAKVNEGLQLEKIDVWYDPMDMMRQIAREHKGEAVDATAATSGCPVLAGARPASE